MKLALLLLALPLAAQTTLSLSGPTSAAPGTSVTITRSSGTSGVSPAALQWTIAAMGQAGTVTIAPAQRATESQKSIVCSPDKRTCLAYGMNTTLVMGGPLATYTLAIPASAAPGSMPRSSSASAAT